MDEAPVVVAPAPPAEAQAAAGGPASPPAARPRERLVLGVPLLDYNAPDPDRDSSNFARAFATTMFANYFVWQYNWFEGARWVRVNRKTWKANLEYGFGFDEDGLGTNFFMHPYHGSFYFNAARGAGLSFWESVPFAAVGSLVWELLGETETASTNDLFATTLGGIALGEMSYRLSSEILDDSTSGGERFLREMGAAVIAPTRGFSRLYSLDGFRTGPGPAKNNPLRVEIHLGMDRLSTLDSDEPVAYRPSFLAGFLAEYGDLQPRQARGTLGAYEWFDLYFAGTVSPEELSGSQVYAHGLLHGWSSPLGEEKGPASDNNVVGVVQSFDYQGANLATFGGNSLGVGNYATWRFGRGNRFRIGGALEWAPMVAARSPFIVNQERGYNISTGASASTLVTLRTPCCGRVMLRSRHYATAIVDGESGQEGIGYAWLVYEYDFAKYLGLGLAPSLVSRASSYSGGRRFATTQLQTRVYVTVHN